MRKIEIQGESKEREDYLKQKMKQLEEDNNKEFNILISFCFNMREVKVLQLVGFCNQGLLS